MLGRSHALSGAVGWLAAGPAVCAAVGAPVGPPEIAAGTLLTAGAALLPDLDHPNSTLSRRLGPAGRVGAAAVRSAAGGHRQLTHSLTFVALAGLGAWALITHAPLVWTAVAVGVLIAVAAALVAPAVGLRIRSATGGAVGVGVGWLLHAGYVDAGVWVVVAATLGVILHIAGDMLTPEGAPLLLPVSSRRFGLPLLTTGGPLEVLVAAGLSVALVVLSYSTFVG